MNKNILLYIGTLLKHINFIMIVLLSFTFMVTAYRICSTMDAMHFLIKLQTVPLAPYMTPILAIGSYIALLIFFQVRKYVGINVTGQIVIVLVEMLLCILIMWVLHWNYSGIIFLLVTELLDYSKTTRDKAVFLAVSFIIYVLADFDLMATRWRINSFNTYLSYYNADTQTVLLGIKTILVSVNILLFVIYMILLIRIQIQENERIQQLNERLNSANAQLVSANMQLEVYAEEIEQMAETRERNRLAREIHDTLGHALTGIIAGIDACMTTVDKAPELTRQQLKAIGEVARNGMKDVRRSVSALRPDVLERLKLSQALEKMVREMATATKAEIRFENRLGNLLIGEDEEEVIYRIIQEGMTNAIRHGKADVIEIRLWREYNLITVWMKDNGGGCKEINYGFGLRHMQERLQMLNGTISCDGREGFTLIAEIPVRWGEELETTRGEVADDEN